MAGAPPTFSEAERDRRWSETRARMDEAGIGALVLIPAGGSDDAFLADQRYLTQIMAPDYLVGMVFPATGDATAVVPRDEDVDLWREAAWADDVRGCGGGWFGAALADRLQELGLADATIGIPHLEPNGASGDSPIPQGSLNALREALPKAHLIDATSLMAEQRSVKSEEETAVLERAVAVAETAIFMLGYEARAGMPQSDAFGVQQSAIARAGGEAGGRILWDCSPTPGRPGFQAPPIPVQRGDVIQNELTVKLRGYAVQEVHPICIGKPPQPVYDAFELCLKIVDQALPLLAPGAPLREVLNVVEHAVEGTAFQTTLVARGCGLAPEPPADDWTLWREGQVLTFGPILQAPDGTRISFRTTVAVTPEGGRRLGKRPLELMLTSRSFMSAYVDSRPQEPTAPWLA